MDDKLVNTFNNEAEFYDEAIQYLIVNYDLILSELLSEIDFDKDANINILDAGCGTGNLLQKLKKEFPNSTIYGLDSSCGMLEIAQKKVPDEKERLICGNILSAEDLPLPSFDLIVVSFVFHNFHSENEHLEAMSQLNSLLAVNGKIIIADLIDSGENENQKKEKKLLDLMKKHNLNEQRANVWLKILRDEDSPLTIEKNKELLVEAGYTDVTSRTVKDSYAAIFTANKDLDIIQVKAELLCYGVQPNAASKELYLAQNPKNITKTGNNGIFLTINGLDVLISINHSANANSPYIFEHLGDNFYLSKRGKEISANIEPIHLPDWAVYPIYDTKHENDCFSNYFVYEGHGFIHLAYKSCSFDYKQKCRFCSVKRREDAKDNTSSDICIALSQIGDKIPDDVHICLGGGTYMPPEKNVAYFKKIVTYIREIGKKNPIWIEMIPPTIPQIQELIDAGATSFGFNIEIWNDETRKNICPGKYELSTKQHYIDSCKYVIDKLGKDHVGSCLIVGLDKRPNLVDAIDTLLGIGIQPCLLMYKKYDNTDIENDFIPPQYLRDFYSLSKYTADKAKQKGLFFKNSEGCLKCNCCTIMHDIQDL